MKTKQNLKHHEQVNMGYIDLICSLDMEADSQLATKQKTYARLSSSAVSERIRLEGEARNRKLRLQSSVVASLLTINIPPLV